MLKEKVRRRKPANPGTNSYICLVYNYQVQFRKDSLLLRAYTFLGNFGKVAPKWKKISCPDSKSFTAIIQNLVSE